MARATGVAGQQTMGKKPQSARRQERKAHRDAETSEIQALRQRLAQPARVPEAAGEGAGGEGAAEEAARFSELPVSSRTLGGLGAAHFVVMTEIQRRALPAALAGQDVLGTARTGSGKTLAFLVPVLERLYLEGWAAQDGLGALVLSPTRELAVQTFEVLKRIGVRHGLSAGLVIGGKDLAAERAVIGRMNILIATPGRLLQHMDQTHGFEWGNLQVLVLDEADRILDLGFAKTLDAILGQLPRSRQTLLFSATHTRDIGQLARLSLRAPVRVDAGAALAATPARLEQAYLVCPLEEKYDRLFSFLKAHPAAKILVFLSSCKQVRFVYEAFCALQPGIPLTCLHGKQKQPKRMQIFGDFCRKQAAAMFATDIAARGLDFPAVDWVLQVDCPEDAETYIHRVGRTARYDAAGSGLLLLLPSEADGMLAALAAAKVPIAPQHPRAAAPPPPKYMLQAKLQALCSADPALKYLGQKALVSYVRSVHLMADKRVFRVDGLPLDALARAMGLPGTPKLRFVARSAAKNASRQLQQAAAAPSDSEGAGEDEEALALAPVGPADPAPRRLVAKSTSRTVERMFGRKNADVLSEHFARLRSTRDGPAPDDELFTLKRSDHGLEGVPEAAGPQSRRAQAAARRRTAAADAPEPQRIVFGDQDEARVVLPYAPESAFDHGARSQLADQFVASARARLSRADPADKERQRALKRAARLTTKRKALDHAGELEREAKAARLETSE